MQKNDNARRIDAILSNDEQSYYESLAYTYIADFIKRTDPNQISAFRLCEAIEADMTRLPILSTKFASKLSKKIAAQEPQAGSGSGKSKGDKPKDGKKDATSKDDKEKNAPKRYYNYSKEPLVADADDWKFLEDWCRKEAKEMGGDKTCPDLLTNLTQVADELKLSEDQKQLLTFLAVHKKVPGLKGIFEELCDDKGQAFYNAVISRMLDIDIDKVSTLLSDDSPILKYGLVTWPVTSEPISEDFDDYMSVRAPGVPKMSPFIARCLSQPNASLASIKSRLAGQPLTTELDWETNFQHMGEDGLRIERLIEKSLEERENGVTGRGPVIVFAGPPDTGKTSAAAALGKHFRSRFPDVEVRIIGEGMGIDEDDESADLSGVKKLSPQDRLSQIMLALAIAGDSNTLFLVEEPDSLMPAKDDKPKGTGDNAIDRVVIQRLIENNPSAALVFTTNGWNDVHPAVKRRTDGFVSFGIPGYKQRKDAIDGLLTGYNEKHPDAPLTLSDADIGRLAETYAVPIGNIASAFAKAARTISQPEELAGEIEHWLKNQSKKDYGSEEIFKQATSESAQSFDLSLCNVKSKDMSPETFLQRVKESPDAALHVLLEGWQGSGKDEFVWHIAETMGKKASQTKAEELVGDSADETEYNVKKFMQDAKKDGMVPVISEIDEVLSGINPPDGSKNKAFYQATWLLAAIKKHPDFLVTTTGDNKRLDAKVYRHFDAVFGFDYLDVPQRYDAFTKFFGTDAPAHSLDEMKNLVPDDFAKVKRKAQFLEFTDDPKKLLDELKAINKQNFEEYKKIAKEDLPAWKLHEHILGFAAAAQDTSRPAPFLEEVAIAARSTNSPSASAQR